jgi:hypothetical protein
VRSERPGNVCGKRAAEPGLSVLYPDLKLYLLVNIDF